MVTRHRYYPISPPEGEMAGRPEGGAAAANVMMPLQEEHP